MMKTLLSIKIRLTVLCALFGFFISYSQTEPNWVKTTVYQEEGEVDATAIVSKTFSDGLGRTLQTQAQLDGSVLVLANAYNDLGRMDTLFKSFTKELNNLEYYDPTGGIITKANEYYDNAPGPDANGYPFSQNVFYDDPLNRLKESGAPGINFSLDGSSGNHIKYWYFGVNENELTNVGGTGLNFEDGLIIGLNNNSEAQLDNLYSYFKENDLFINPEYYLTVSKDPNDHFSQELKDLSENTIKTWADSDDQSQNNEIVADYQFDALDNLLKEFPPSTNSGSSSPYDKTEYRYNTLSQLISKRSPDFYRIAGISDPDNDDYWNFRYRYDHDGRLLETIKPDGTIIQYRYDRLGRIINTGTLEGSEFKIWIYNVYDRLTIEWFNTLKLSVSSYEVNTILTNLGKPENLRGKLVASVAIDQESNTRIADIYSYDDDGRVELKYKIVPPMKLQKFMYEYDLQGRIIKEIRYNGSERLEDLVYIYNGKQGQLTGIYREIENHLHPFVNYSYNDRGLLQEKRFPHESSPEPITMNYNYNIRDWLSSINMNTESDFFTQDIFYDNPPAGSPPDINQFNGNINSVRYEYAKPNPPGGNDTYSISYHYDQVNRLIAAEETNDRDCFDETISYDNIGRISSKSEGTSGCEHYNSHDEYTYYDNGNRLKKSKNSQSGFPYVYDRNGNLIIDRTKNMVIKYDWRDMPVWFGFYDLTNYGITPNADGFFTGDPYSPLDNLACYSEVRMMYDASGERVYKIEFADN